MSEAFINCPECEALLMADTARCPQCSYVIDADRADAASDTSNDWSITHHSAVVECPKCGEFNGSGLVRCWGCAGFLRPEIEALYLKMLAERAEVEFTPLPEISLSGEIRLPEGFLTDSETQVDDEPTTAPKPVAPPTVPEDAEVADEFELNPAFAEFVENDPDDFLPPAESEETAAAAAVGEPAPPADTTTEVTAEAEAGREAESEPDTGVPHSEATGGDALLEIALQEEQETDAQRAAREKVLAQRRNAKAARRKKAAGPRPAGSAGSSVVQTKSPAAKKKRPEPPRKFPLWLDDVPLHEFVPSKIRMKPGSVESQYRSADVGFSAERLCVAVVVKPAGMFSRSTETKDKLREKLRKHLESETAKEGDVPATAHLLLPREKADQLKVVQPAAALHESMFAGEPVFGEGRVAVLLPREVAKGEPQWFLSFTLTEFRRFADAVAAHLGVKDLGLVEGVPLTDRYLPAQCHYSETTFEALPVEQLPFYQADPALNLELLGRRCQACGLVVGEDARRKEKIGGLNGNGIAKAKCPKCGAKFGATSLYRAAAKPAALAAKEPATADAAS